ncbi:MAG: hypothetical protein P8Y52_14680 [Xanthomonadales bacterium]
MALMQWRLKQARLSLLVGLAFVTMGVAIKSEGVVWLAAFLVLWFVLATRWWVSLSLAVALALLVAAGLYFGIEPLNLPFGQTLSIVGDRIDLPFIEPFVLEVYNPWRTYTRGMFEMDSWNLLWTVLVATAAVALARVKRPDSRIVLGFLLIFCATQLFIFGVTQHGAFGESQTASNRLAMHFLPALIFGAAVVLAPLLTTAFDSKPVASLWRRAAPPILAAALVASGAAYLITQPAEEPVTPQEPLQFKPVAFKPIVGKWSSTIDTLRLIALQDGFGAASVQDTEIVADENYLLHFTLDAGSDDLRRPVVFWRTRENPQNVAQLDLWDDQSEFIDLRRQPDWTGTVVELGFMFRELGDQPLDIRDVWLGVDTVDAQLEKYRNQWFQSEPWTQRSVNFRIGGAADQSIYLPVLLATWFVLTLLIGAVLLHGDRAAILRAAALVLLAGWLILDVRWTFNRWALADEAYADLRVNESERLKGAIDGDLAAFAAALKRMYLDAEPGRILLLNDGSVPDYYEFKIKYFLLPQASGQGKGRMNMTRLETIDYILMLTERVDAGDLERLQAGSPDAWARLNLPESVRRDFVVLAGGPFGVLLARPAGD